MSTLLNYVEQIVELIKAVVDAGGKAIWSVLVASCAVLIVDHIWPEMFLGLPEWVLPLLLVVVIFCAVLAFGSFLTWLSRLPKKFVVWVSAPLREKSIRVKLLSLNYYEVLVLCKALARNDRTVGINPDAPLAISLQDKGLLESYGRRSFEIPMEVWRMMLSMEEFFMPNPGVLLETLEVYCSDAPQVLKALPQAHPAIKRRYEVARG